MSARPCYEDRRKDLPTLYVFRHMSRSHQTSYVQPDDGACVLPSGILIRALESSDRAGLASLFARLSPESRHSRFLGPKPELTARELTYLTAVDHHSHEALAAVNRRDGLILGVARYVGVPGRRGIADTAIALADELQGKGIGTALARALVSRASVNGFDALTAATLWHNRPARSLLRRLGFRACSSQGSALELELDLHAEPPDLEARNPPPGGPPTS